MKTADSGDELLVEVAYEVCQQLGGIYTVIRSKIVAARQRFQANYCLIGPYNPETASVEFEEMPLTGVYGQTAQIMQDMGFDVRYGRWLVSGQPTVVLFNLSSAHQRLADIKYYLWENHKISTLHGDGLLDQVLCFGFLVEEFLAILASRETDRQIIAHFHEWMGGSAIPNLRRRNLSVAIVFTTHATLLGRYLAMNDSGFYDHLPFVDWAAEARRFNIEAPVQIERAAAHGAHLFTTVSEITALECKYLLGRNPDMTLPNGLNIERFVARHESEILHQRYKEKIEQFVMGYFFSSYSFDLDNTLYFFITGRYEYKNKGFDLALEALARLNWRLKQKRSEKTVVAFFITKRPYKSINPDVLARFAIMEEIRKDCEAIKNEVGEKLFLAATRNVSPSLDKLAGDYWRLRLRRTMQAWRVNRLPYVVTHHMWDENDEILEQVRTANLVNNPDDPVKIVYHPDFIQPTNPLFGMDYDQFVRGCHLGIFPSYYEPWGYTPLECIARGIPAITSDLSGFGSYVQNHHGRHLNQGLYVLARNNQSYWDAAEDLTKMLDEFVSMERRDRIIVRNTVEGFAQHFDWHNLYANYLRAYLAAAKKVQTAAA